MQVKAWANEVRAFLRYRSADGTEGLTALVAGIQFKNGLYVGGTFSAAALPITTNNITINGTAGNGYIQYGAQTVAPSLALVHTFADSGGHFAIGQSGSSGKTISFTNGLMTADRSYAFQNKSGTLAMTDDNISQFVNNARYIVGPAGAVSGNIPTFNGVTGYLAQDSGIAITSVVLNTRTLTEGAGLAGNTYDLSANRTFAMGTPSTLSIASTNAVSGTTHSHVITTSSNPGATAAILSTDASGFLTLKRLTLTDYVFVNAATANLYLKDTSTGFQAATSSVVTLQSGNTLRSSAAFVSGVTGWNETSAGDAEFNNVRIRGELAASVFKISEISATAGTFGVFYSAATVAADFTTPASTGTTFYFEAKKSDVGGSLLANGDRVRLKSWTGSGISDAWIEIVSQDATGSTVIYESILRSGSTSATFRTGTAIVDYGPSGTGFITLSADGTVGSSPNMTMATHAGSPWSGQTVLLRLGNLNGSYGYATDVYGLGIGQYGTASKSWLTVEQTNGFRIGNNTTVLAQWDTSGGILLGDSAAQNVSIDSSNGVRIRNGSTVLTQLDASGNVVFGQVATNKANVYWNASNSRLEFRGSTSGTVVQSYIDTDGSFVAGTGAVKVNAGGIFIDSVSTSTVKSVNWGSGSDISAMVFGNWGGTGGSSSFAVLEADLPSSSSGQAAFAFLTAKNDAGVAGNLFLTTVGSTSGTNPNNSYLNLTGGALLGLVIGSAAVPTHMLDVYGTGWFQGSSYQQVISASTDAVGSGITFVPSAAGGRSYTVLATANSAGVGGGRWAVFDEVASSYRLSINSTGNARLHAYGAGTLTTDASGNITATSDERMKTRIRKFRKGVETIKRLEPIFYRWNKKSGLDTQNDYVGFGARHTKKHLPEAIGKMKNGFHTMSDRVLLATLVNAVKELDAKLCHS